MAVWQLRLLGGLRAERGRQALEHFPSRAVALLLARLALPPLRSHPREELIELLWPEAELEAGRNRLRQALSTLRRLIEPPDLPPQSVLRADRQSIALRQDAIKSDLADFESHLRRGETSEALACYGGDFLPGYFDEWVDEERQRLCALYERALLSRKPGRGEPERAAAAESYRAVDGEAERALPAYPSLFCGREGELGEVLAEIACHRLVTLTAPGGFGKTRLAVECAARAQGFDRVAFVPLAECSSVSAFEETMCEALGMPAADQEPDAQLAAFLADRSVLVILDGCEQLGGEALDALGRLLERLPRLHAIVTSRSALRLPGERTVALDALPVPDSGMPLARAVQTPSLALFVDRARGARADFAPTEDNRETLIALTRKLEGLPLAIEIAASRIRSYSPAEMLAALEARFTLLQRIGAKSARYGRHASLLAAIEWSWEQLPAPARELYSALSVLGGSWPVTTAAEVLDQETSAVHLGLDQLVSASLLRSEADAAGRTRFSMFDTLREFASAQLDAGRKRSLRKRQRAVFLARARALAASGETVDEADWPNYRAALSSAIADGEAAGALELALALRPRWEAKGVNPEEFGWISAGVEAAADPILASAGQELLARIKLAAGELEAAKAHAERALTAAGKDSGARGRALLVLAWAIWEREPLSPVTPQALREALQLAHGGREPMLEAETLRIQGTIALEHGAENADYAGADACLQRAVQLYRREGALDCAYRVLLTRVACLTGRKQEDEAERLLDECEAHFSIRGSIADLVAAANMRGYLESGRGNWPAALAAAQECVRLAWANHARRQLILALWNLPQALLKVGAIDAAVRMIAFAAVLWENNIGPLSAGDREHIGEIRGQAVREFGSREAARRYAEGANMKLAAAVAYALTTV